MSQQIRGHLFVFLDSIMGLTFKSADDLAEDQASTRGELPPFERKVIQKLLRTFLRFTTAYFLKLAKLGKSVSSPIYSLLTVLSSPRLDPGAEPSAQAVPGRP